MNCLECGWVEFVCLHVLYFYFFQKVRARAHSLTMRRALSDSLGLGTITGDTLVGYLHVTPAF